MSVERERKKKKREMRTSFSDPVLFEGGFTRDAYRLPPPSPGLRRSQLNRTYETNNP
ncbi:hypothetical protein NOK12_39260 [Nocardioides sp. OK12]|nr:hypothetical protein NOK12_39260 [Nocardioides sp. OK12]